MDQNHPIPAAFIAEFVTTCYEQILGRAPERQGLESHSSSISKLDDLLKVIKVFGESSEFKARLRAQPIATRFSSSDSVLHFVHIPKTGGMSVHEWLKTIYQDKLFPSYFVQDLVRLRDKLAEYQIYSGHFFGALDIFTGVPSQKATLLRDPLDRAISQYHHIKRDSSVAMHRPFQSLSFKEVLYSDALRPIIGENYQAKCLLWLTQPGMGFRQSHSPALDSISDDDLFGKATDTLKKIQVVGVFEKMSNFLQNLSEAWNFSSAVPFPKVNVGTNRIPVDLENEDIDFFIKKNRVDYDLYRIAAAR